MKHWSPNARKNAREKDALQPTPSDGDRDTTGHVGKIAGKDDWKDGGWEAGRITRLPFPLDFLSYKNAAVRLSFTFFTASSVPVATIRPPASPPPGPRSTM